MIVILRLVLLFSLSILSSQAWIYAPQASLAYSCDAVDYLVIDRNIESQVQSQQYDGLPNLHDCCSESLSRDLQEKALDGYFFTLLPNYFAIKKTGKELTTFFPPNNGFLGSTTKTTLKPGQTIDRFGGSDISRFFSPTGTPAAMRSLPPGTASQPLRSFEVLKPIGVESGRIAPAFNQIGLGTQFRSGKQLGELLDGGFLREIAK